MLEPYLVVLADEIHIKKKYITRGDVGNQTTHLQVGSKIYMEPWLVWFSGLSDSLQTKGLLVPFPV